MRPRKLDFKVLKIDYLSTYTTHIIHERILFVHLYFSIMYCFIILMVNFWTIVLHNHHVTRLQNSKK